MHSTNSQNLLEGQVLLYRRVAHVQDGVPGALRAVHDRFESLLKGRKEDDKKPTKHKKTKVKYSKYLANELCAKEKVAATEPTREMGQIGRARRTRFALW